MRAFEELGELINEILYISYYGWGHDDGDIPGVPNMIQKSRMQSGTLSVKDQAVYAILGDLEKELAGVIRSFQRRLYRRAPGERWRCIACGRSNHESITGCVCGYAVTKKGEVKG